MSARHDEVRAVSDNKAEIERLQARLRGARRDSERMRTLARRACDLADIWIRPPDPRIAAIRAEIDQEPGA